MPSGIPKLKADKLPSMEILSELEKKHGAKFHAMATSISGPKCGGVTRQLRSMARNDPECQKVTEQWHHSLKGEWEGFVSTSHATNVHQNMHKQVPVTDPS